MNPAAFCGNKVVNDALFYMLLIGRWYLNKSSLVSEELFYMGEGVNASEGPAVKTHWPLPSLLTRHSKTHHIGFVSSSRYAAVGCEVRGCNVLNDNLWVSLTGAVHQCMPLEVWSNVWLSWRVAQSNGIYPICFNPFPHHFHWISNFVAASNSNISSWPGKHRISLFLWYFKSICWKTSKQKNQTKNAYNSFEGSLNHVWQVLMKFNCSREIVKSFEILENIIYTYACIFVHI